MATLDRYLYPDQLLLPVGSCEPFLLAGCSCSLKHKRQQQTEVWRTLLVIYSLFCYSAHLSFCPPSCTRSLRPQPFQTRQSRSALCWSCPRAQMLQHFRGDGDAVMCVCVVSLTVQIPAGKTLKKGARGELKLTKVNQTRKKIELISRSGSHEPFLLCLRVMRTMTSTMTTRSRKVVRM